MSHSAAFERFMKSTNIGQEEWRDGTPYDMEAFAELNAGEQREIIAHLCSEHGPKFDWRDIEVFQAAGNSAGVAILQSAMMTAGTETRLHAAVALHEMGKLPELMAIVAKELDRVKSFEGLSYALDLIEEKSPEIVQALLRGAKKRPDVAPHFAAKLCQIMGKAKTDFDWEMRPFFLKFGEDSTPAERAEAYRELCAIAGVKV